MTETTGADGYITDRPYLIKFFRQTCPSDIVSVARAAGVAGPKIDAPFRYLDLGCGRALTLLVLAAAYPQAEFFGVDMNPAFIVEARERAKAAGLTNLTLIEAEFGTPELTRLPQMEFIVSHGTVTWVSELVLQDLYGLVSDRLADNGLAYLSYNLRAGFAQMDPVRVMMTRLAASRSDLAEGTRYAAAKLRRMAETEQRFFVRNEQARRRVEAWTPRDLDYLSHEYLNVHWQPRSFGEIADATAAHDLHFVGDPVARRWMETRQAQALAGALEDPVLVEDMASFCVGQAFRADIYQKDEAFSLRRPVAFDSSDRFITQPNLAIGDGPEKAAAALLEACRTPRSFDDLAADEALKSVRTRRLADRLRQAMAAGWIVAVSPEMPADLPTEAPLTGHVHPLTKLLLEDDEIARRPIPLPSAAMGGALNLPPRVGAALLTAEHGADGWVARTAARLMTLKDQPGEDADAKTLAEATDAVEALQETWAPWLVTAGILGNAAG